MGFCKFVDINMLLSSVEFIKGFISGYIDKKYIDNDIVVNSNEIIIKYVYKETYNKKDIFTMTENNYV
jgi:hypothetical protein